MTYDTIFLDLLLFLLGCRWRFPVIQLVIYLSAGPRASLGLLKTFHIHSNLLMQPDEQPFNAMGVWP